MLEKMGDFFDNRLDGSEEHQLTCIESARGQVIRFANGNLKGLSF